MHIKIQHLVSGTSYTSDEITDKNQQKEMRVVLKYALSGERHYIGITVDGIKTYIPEKIIYESVFQIID
jgi:hypothetical protein